MSAAPAAERIVPQPTPTLADSTLPTIKFIPVPDRSPVFDPSLSHTLDRFLLLELLYAFCIHSVKSMNNPGSSIKRQALMV